jgi:hypothetical protein
MHGADRTQHHPISRSSSHRVPDMCIIILGPLHQVSYSWHDPYRCPPCRTCHLHSTRQANTILRIRSPTPVMILIAARHAAPATYTARDKQARFFKQNKDKGKNQNVPDSNSNLVKSMTHYNQTKELATWILICIYNYVHLCVCGQLCGIWSNKFCSCPPQIHYSLLIFLSIPVSLDPFLWHTERGF